MIHIPSLEKLGSYRAIMSERIDGDALTESGLSGILNSLNLELDHLSTVHQVHGAHIVESSKACSEADGIITNTPGDILGIRIADCVPIYIIDPKTPSIGLFHAGREGTLKEISVHGIQTMVKLYGTQPEYCHAYIGPSAGPCCYQVSEEIAHDFKSRGWETKGRYLDLWATNTLQLQATGIPLTNIMSSEICTICNHQFFSFRNGDEKARNIAILTL